MTTVYARSVIAAIVSRSNPISEPRRGPPGGATQPLILIAGAIIGCHPRRIYALLWSIPFPAAKARQTGAVIPAYLSFPLLQKFAVSHPIDMDTRHLHVFTPSRSARRYRQIDACESDLIFFIEGFMKLENIKTNSDTVGVGGTDLACLGSVGSRVLRRMFAGSRVPAVTSNPYWEAHCESKKIIWNRAFAAYRRMFVRGLRMLGRGANWSACGARAARAESPDHFARAAALSGNKQVLFDSLWWADARTAARTSELHGCAVH